MKSLRRGFSAHPELAEGDCAIEGLKTIEEALRSGIRFKVVVFSESGLQKAERIILQLRAKVEVLAVPDEVFRSIVETESPQGVAALVSLPESSLEQILRPPDKLVVVAAGVQDPGNLGTMFRSAEAFGATGFLLAEKTVSRSNPKVIRASTGSIFRLPTASIKSHEALPRLRDHGVRLLGTAAHSGVPMDQAGLTGECAIVIGNEGSGLPQSVLSQMDELITIPHAKSVESLNAGIATSLILYEVSRQRARQSKEMAR